jgi:type II secretory pathway component GspD/PulD (secretin)
LVAAAIVLAPAPARAQKVKKKALTMRVGDQVDIPAIDVLRFSEGTKGIVDVRLPEDKDLFVIVALRPGRTSLLLFMRDGSRVQYKITVAGSEAKGSKVKEVDNIRLDFYFVELSSNYTRQLGLGFPAAIGGADIFRIQANYDLQAGDFVNATAVVANQPLPRLDILHATGWAKISRQAAVIAANGTEANFSSGGEVNIQVQGALTAEIRQIEFGSNVRVQPRYDPGSGRVELRISSEVAELTSGSSSGIPGRSISKLDTVVNLELGQSVMLAGLNAKSEVRGKSGLPFLSQIPVIGLLFGSHSTRRDEVRNVIFIVPTVVSFTSRDSRQHIKEALKAYREFEGTFEVDFKGKPGKRESKQ